MESHSAIRMTRPLPHQSSPRPASSATRLVISPSSVPTVRMKNGDARRGCLKWMVLWILVNWDRKAWSMQSWSLGQSLKGPERCAARNNCSGGAVDWGLISCSLWSISQFLRNVVASPFFSTSSASFCSCVASRPRALTKASDPLGPTIRSRTSGSGDRSLSRIVSALSQRRPVLVSSIHSTATRRCLDRSLSLVRSVS